MKLLCLILVLIFAGCANTPPVATHIPVLRITEIAPNKLTAIARQNLEHLLGVYHLSPLLFSEDVAIQSNAIPHAHPTLTLNTRFAEQPHKLLSAFIHEQLHWWTAKNKKSLGNATKDLKKLYPKLPEHSSYEHVVVCFLEYDGLIFYLGQKEANKIIHSFIQHDKLHPWMYSEVLTKYKALNRIITRHKLKPAPFN